MNKVICIVGPTGIGKTALSIALAKQFNSEIINGDAIQVFKEGDILSAKASIQEQDGIKHYLLDFRELENRYDIAQFKQDADYLIEQINKAGKIPIIVGGSGLYIKALLFDYELQQINSKSSLTEQKYQDYSNEQLFEHLKTIDPTSAQPLHPNNRKRVLRAIDIFENNDVSKSEFINKQEKKMVYDALVFGLRMERPKLYERINNRVDIMIKNGLIEEVIDLSKRYDVNKDYQLFQAIGFKEFIPYLHNEITLEQAIDKIKQNSRRYAKKQITWFNNQMDVTWLDVDIDNFDKTINEAINIVKEQFYGKNTI